MTSVLTLSLTASPTALAFVLGGLLDGLFGSMVKFGVGVGELVLICNVGEAGAVEAGVPFLVSAGEDTADIKRSIAVICLPVLTFLSELSWGFISSMKVERSAPSS